MLEHRSSELENQNEQAQFWNTDRVNWRIKMSRRSAGTQIERIGESK